LLRDKGDRVALWSLLQSDLRAEHLMMLIERNGSGCESTGRSILTLRELVAQFPPQLFRAFDHIREFMARLDPDCASFKDIVDSLRQAAFGRRGRLESEMREPEK